MNNLRLPEGLPAGTMISTRVLLHRKPNKRHKKKQREQRLLSLVLRTGRTGVLGFGGGRLRVRECLRARVHQEVAEEFGPGMWIKGKLHFLTVLYAPRRFRWYPVKDYEEHGFSTSGLKVKNGKVLVWNPLTIVFVAAIKGKLPDRLIEGRKVVQLDLRRRSSLKKLKRSHRAIARRWRDYVRKGKPIPPLFEWRVPVVEGTT